MPVQLLFFLTWKTYGGQATISEAVADDLLRLLPRLARTEGAAILEAAVVSTHVHVVLSTNRRPDIPRIVQRLKGASARLINRESEDLRRLHWAPGYDVRTIGQQSMAVVGDYFDRQAQKHRLLWVRRYSASHNALTFDD